MLWCSPVYVTQQRRNAAGVGLVFEADLDTTEHSSLWVLQVLRDGFVMRAMIFSIICVCFGQGVALCLNIAD
jgi:hypothetical protein